MLGNPFRVEGQWYKCALHVHTTDSDGELSPVDTVKRYAEEGFDVVCMTDHGGSEQLPVLVDGIRVFPGAEILAFGKLHLVVLGLEKPRVYEQSQAEVEVLIEQARSGEIALLLGHPYWSHLRLSEMMLAQSVSAVEVYNSVCDIERARGYAGTHLDELLDVRGNMWAVATDDCHCAYHIGKGWTMVKLTEPTSGCLADALRNGWCYASTGVNIHELIVQENRIHVACDPVVRINFVAGPGACLGKSFFSGNGPSLVEVDWELTQEYTGYVRIECLAADGQRAWSNPFKCQDGRIIAWPAIPAKWSPDELRQE